MPVPIADIQRCKAELSWQLHSILDYWSKYSPDPRDGGFFGEITDQNMAVVEAKKGSVLNARILWSFSRGFQVTGDKTHLQLANNAFLYFQKHFLDPAFGGAYWTIPAPGHDLKTEENSTQPGRRKQIYAQAFWMYALSEYYAATRDKAALQIAKDLYQLIQTHSYDEKKGGYLEAFSRDWSPVADLRLSAKDANEAKTMNTHLHIMEAYMRLYREWPDPALKQQLMHLLYCFDQFIIDPVSSHLHLFFDANWKVKGQTFSYGHDIEAAWLLLEAATIIKDDTYITKMKTRCVALARSASAGLDLQSGGLNYESILNTDHQWVLIQEKHWWVQAEAMVGFLEAFIQSGEEHFYHQAVSVWHYIQNYLLSETGEWRWGIDPSGQPMSGFYKAGLWKCPYHNLRAMIEATYRLDKILSQQVNFNG